MKSLQKANRCLRTKKRQKNSQCLDRELGNYYIKQELDDLRLKHTSVPSILQLIRDS